MLKEYVHAANPLPYSVICEIYVGFLTYGIKIEKHSGGFIQLRITKGRTISWAHSAEMGNFCRKYAMLTGKSIYVR